MRNLRDIGGAERTGWLARRLPGLHVYSPSDGATRMTYPPRRPGRTFWALLAATAAGLVATSTASAIVVRHDVAQPRDEENYDPDTDPYVIAGLDQKNDAVCFLGMGDASCTGILIAPDWILT